MKNFKKSLLISLPCAALLFGIANVNASNNIKADSISYESVADQESGALQANQQEAKINGVYRVDSVIKFNGKWYVVNNAISIPPIDYHNYIPVGPLTATDSKGNKSKDQTLRKGGYFTFSGLKFPITQLSLETITVTIGGEPVAFNRKAFGKNLVISDKYPDAKYKVGETVKIASWAGTETNGFDLRPHRGWVGKVKAVTKKKYSHSYWEYWIVYPKGGQNVHVSEQDIIYPPSPDNLKKIKEAGIKGFNSGLAGYPAHQCTSFVAGILSYKGVDINKYRALGNGADWANSARSRGVKVDMTPTPGSVVSFKGVPPLYPAPYGHVAYVTSVNADGSFHLYEGNWNSSSFHERDAKVDNAVAGFIHF